MSQWLVNQDFSKPGRNEGTATPQRVWWCWMEMQTQKGWAGLWSPLGSYPTKASQQLLYHR